MRCPKCGYQNIEDAVSCNLCQENLKKKNFNDNFRPQLINSEVEKSKSKRWIFYLLAFTIIIVVINYYPRYKTYIKISEFNQNVIKSDLPVLVDFYAPWCSICQTVAPVIEELEIEYKNKIVFYKINIDENKELVNLYDISGIPAFIFIKKGKIAGRITGSTTKEFFKSKINEILAQE